METYFFFLWYTVFTLDLSEKNTVATIASKLYFSHFIWFNKYQRVYITIYYARIVLNFGRVCCLNSRNTERIL